jgi:hypothetical protein
MFELFSAPQAWIALLTLTALELVLLPNRAQLPFRKV